MQFGQANVEHFQVRRIKLTKRKMEKEKRGGYFQCKKNNNQSSKAGQGESAPMDTRVLHLV